MLLGTQEVPGARAESESQYFGMPLHAPCRKADTVCGRTVSKSRYLSVEAGLPDLQRIRDVAIQEAGTRFVDFRGRQVETRDASDPPAVRGHNDSERRICASARFTTPGLIAFHSRRRNDVGRGEQVEVSAASGV